MARTENPRIKEGLHIFRKQKVLSIVQLVEIMHCSASNLRLKLKRWKTWTSYNFNGKYYCLPDIPSFDANGLWKYKDIYFSQYGTLKNTVVSLVQSSSSGLSGENIGEIVKLSPRSFLHHLNDIPGMQRIKQEGRYIYFSDDTKRYDNQLLNRISLMENKSLPSDAEAVVILLQFIKHPNVSIDEITSKVAKTGKRIDFDVIRRFLEHHGLFKKKT